VLLWLESSRGVHDLESRATMRAQQQVNSGSRAPYLCAQDGRMSGWLTVRSGPLLLNRERYFFRFRWGFLSQYLTENSSAVQRFCVHAAMVSLHPQSRKILLAIGPLGMLGAHGADTPLVEPTEQDLLSAHASRSWTSPEADDAPRSESRLRKQHVPESSPNLKNVESLAHANRSPDVLARVGQVPKRIILVADTDEEFRAWGLLLETARMRNIARWYCGLARLGQGASGDVIVASSSRRANELVAIKRMEYRRATRTGVARQLRRIHKEIQIQNKAAMHSSIPVRIYDVFFDSRFVYIVMEYVPGVTLSEWMSASDCGVPEDIAVSVVRQIARCIMILHQHKIVHRDIKADNCLIELDADGKPGNVRLIDFGFAEVYRGGHGTSMTNFCSGFLGTASYMAPEIGSFEQYGYPVDLFALGVLVHLLLLRVYPFDSKSLIKTLDLIREGNTYLLCTSVGISRDARSFCLSLLNKDPRKRLTAAGALQHRWVRRGRNVTENALRSPDMDRSPRAWLRRVLTVVSVVFALRQWSNEPAPLKRAVPPEIMMARTAMLDRLDKVACGIREPGFRQISAENCDEEEVITDDLKTKACELV
jgi:tRNA A-37 threonylcarbamoyl transferase component Bud32